MQIQKDIEKEQKDNPAASRVLEWNNLSIEEKSICIWNGLGSTQEEIKRKYKEIFNKSPSNYMRIMRKLRPFIRDLASQAPAESLVMLQLASQTASSKIISLVESKNEKIALEASKDILDRAIPRQEQVTNVQINMPTIYSSDGSPIEM